MFADLNDPWLIIGEIEAKNARKRFDEHEKQIQVGGNKQSNLNGQTDQRAGNAGIAVVHN